MRRQVEQILSSPDFDASRRSKEFLRFIVEEALAGRGEELTQAAIATGVFGRRDDFDAVVDPIVRIQAGRLRRSLERYYLLSGKTTRSGSTLPRGTYVPAFRAQALPEPAGADRVAAGSGRARLACRGLARRSSSARSRPSPARANGGGGDAA